MPHRLPALSLWIFSVSSSKLFYLTKLVMWFEHDVSSSVFIVEKTLYCVSGVYALGAGPDVDTLLFTAAHVSLLTNGSWGWSLPFTPPPHSALQCPGKNRPDFLKTSYRFIAVSTLLSFSLLFSANKKIKGENVSFLPQLRQRSQDYGIYLLHLYRVLLEQFSPPSKSIYLPDSQSGLTGNSAYGTSTHQSL